MSACTDFVPGHGVDSQPMNTTPYSIKVNEGRWQKSGTLSGMSSNLQNILVFWFLSRSIHLLNELTSNHLIVNIKNSVQQEEKSVI